MMLCLLIVLPLIAIVKANNPFQKGCLYSKNLTTKIRVCGSEDPPEAALNGICRPPPIDYAEIRLLPSDWESTFFESWILQIALSEILNVPTSIEMGDPNLQLDFYHPDSPMDFPVNDYKKSLEVASLLDGECNQADTNHHDGTSCGHFNPESWGARNQDVQNMVSRGVVEPPKALGMITQEGWYVPKFTAQRDPSLLSYIGLQGEENRRKLADRFRRPTTWKDYCELVSPDNCTTPNEVAQRGPLDSQESNMMFGQDLYTGYFRANDKNNCTLNPTNCAGHFADYPCAWTSPVTSQLHYLNISLDPDMETGGYDYSQLIQIWKAANATKSDVVMYWWSQDLLYDEFFGTEAEFTPVTMPPATQECIEARPDGEQRCSDDPDVRVGAPEAVCGEPPKNLHGVMSGTVYDQAYNGRCPARYSPSHSALMHYQLSELQVDEIFAHWIRLDDPREALCEWVSENMEYMESFVPRTYPRTLEQKDEKGALFYASTTIGLIVMVMVALTLVLVHRNKEQKAIQYAQIEFLDLLLLGSLLIAAGAVLMGAPSSNFTCTASIWLINLGYTLELVPLIVKVGALLHIMSIGKRMQRVEIKREMLFGVVTIISIFMVIFLFIWTILDSPTPTPEYELTDDINEDGDTVVLTVDVCGSDSVVWSYMSVAWNGTLLLITTVLAFRMRKLTVRGFNEAPTLALLVYSHFFFVLLRVITYMLSSNVSGYTLARCLSLIFSADTACTLVIYFVPKFLARNDSGGSTVRVSGSGFSGSGFNQSTDWYSARFSAGSINQMRQAFSVSRELSDSAAPAASEIPGAFDPTKDSEQPAARICCSANIEPPRDGKTDGTSPDANGSDEGSILSQKASIIQKRLSQTLQLSNWIVMDDLDASDREQGDHDESLRERETRVTAPKLLEVEGEDLVALTEMASLMDEIERLERKTTSLQVEKDFQASRLLDLEEENSRLKKLELLWKLPVDQGAAEGDPGPPDIVPTAA